MQAIEHKMLKKWFQSQIRQNNNNCQLSQDRGLMHDGAQRGKVGRYVLKTNFVGTALKHLQEQMT